MVTIFVITAFLSILAPLVLGVCPPDVTATCDILNLGLPPGFAGAYEPFSDNCAAGSCMLIFDEDHLTQNEALDHCSSLGGDLIRWDSDQCFADIEANLNCQGYNDSVIFWTSADLEVDTTLRVLKNKVWQKKVNGNVKLFNADFLTINEKELDDASFRAVAAHLNSDGVLKIKNLPGHSKNCFICIGFDDIFWRDCTLIPRICEFIDPIHPICFNKTCHGCNPDTETPCVIPKDKCVFNDSCHFPGDCNHGVYDCGDPHVEAYASNSDYPVCYGLYGVAQRFYRLIKSSYGSVDAEMDVAHLTTAPYARFTVKLLFTLRDGSTILFTPTGITVNGKEYQYGSPYSVDGIDASVKFVDSYTTVVTFGTSTFQILLVAKRLDFYLIDGSLDTDSGIFGDMARARIEPTPGATDKAVLYIDGAKDEVTLGSRNEVESCWLVAESSPIIAKLILDYDVTIRPLA